MLQKTVKIGEQDVTFKSSAAIPRMYRGIFKRDIFKDMTKLQSVFAENIDKDRSTMEVEDLELFENVAYIMARHANPNIPDTIDEWLEQFEMFSIYQILPEILELWGDNAFADVKAKKNPVQQNAK